MTLTELDSRTLSGTDIEYPRYLDGAAGMEGCTLYPPKQRVRVILGKFGNVVRMSAPELDIITEGSNRDEAWAKFLEVLKIRFKPEDNAWFSFDVGPTRREEIEEGLNAPEDEDWTEPVVDAEG